MTSPNQAPVPGDEFIIRGDLVQYPNLIGFDEITCTATFNSNFLCTVVWQSNQGQISGQALLAGG